MGGTKNFTTVRKSAVTLISSATCTRGFQGVKFRVKKLHKYTSLGKAHLLIWHRLVVGTRKELCVSEELKMFEAWTHLINSQWKDLKKLPSPPVPQKQLYL